MYVSLYIHIYRYLYVSVYIYINKYIYIYKYNKKNDAGKSLKRTASYRIGTQLEPQAIELKLIKNPLLTNLLPVGIDTLRIESVSESR